MFRPVRKLAVGVKSKPMPQLVAFSGVRPFQLPSQPPPARMASEPRRNHRSCEMPGSCWCRNGEAGRRESVGQVVALPRAVSGAESSSCSFQAPEPTGGRLTPGVQPAVIDARLRGQIAEVLAGDGDVGERREFAEHRCAERRAPRAADGEGVDRRPVERHLRIAGALHVAVLVVTPGEFQIHTAQERQGVLLAEERNVDLGERGPDLTALRILLIRHDQAGGAGVVEHGGLQLEAGVGRADRGLDRAARKIEQRAVELHALFIDPKPLVKFLMPWT